MMLMALIIFLVVLIIIFVIFFFNNFSSSNFVISQVKFHKVEGDDNAYFFRVGKNLTYLSSFGKAKIVKGTDFFDPTDEFEINSYLYKNISKEGLLKLKTGKTFLFKIEGEISCAPVFVKNYYYCVVKNDSSETRLLRFSAQDPQNYMISDILKPQFGRIMDTVIENDGCRCFVFNGGKSKVIFNKDIEQVFIKASGLCCYCVNKNDIEKCGEDFEYVFYRENYLEINREIIEGDFNFVNIIRIDKDMGLYKEYFNIDIDDYFVKKNIRRKDYVLINSRRILWAE